MKVLYIIAGIIIGIPIYILANILLAWIGKFFVGLARFLSSNSFKEAKELFISEIHTERGSMSSVLINPGWAVNIFGWFLFIGFVGLFAVGLIHRLLWLIWIIIVGIFKLICKLLKFWLHVVNSCWNLGKNKTKK